MREQRFRWFQPRIFQLRPQTSRSRDNLFHWCLSDFQNQEGYYMAVGLGHISEKAMAPHSSTLAWKIPWTEEPGRLQSTGSLRVGHDWATSLSLFTFMHWRRKWQPTPGNSLENPRGRGAWWADVYGVTQSPRRLKWFSSSSSRQFTLKKKKNCNLFFSFLCCLFGSTATCEQQSRV